VSVVIPARNAEATLGDAIESVLAQTFTDWELIIADDASIDATAQVARQYAHHPNIHFYQNDQRLGKWPNHNRVAALARAPLLKFLHADDLLLPDCLRHMVHCLERFPEAALVQAHEVKHYLAPKLQTPREAYQQEFFGEVTLWGSPTSVLYRKSIWDATGGFDPHCASAPAELRLDVARHNPVVLVYGGLVWSRRGSRQKRPAPATWPAATASEFGWLRAALDHPQCPLTPAERTSARRNVAIAAARATIAALREGRWREAFELRRRAGPWLSLPGTALEAPIAYGLDFWYRLHLGTTIFLAEDYPDATPVPRRAGTATRPPTPKPRPALAPAGVSTPRRALISSHLGGAMMGLRMGLFRGFFASGLTRVLLARRGLQYCILSYHGVSSSPKPLFTSAALFEQHLQLFQRWGQTTSMDEVAAFLAGEPVSDGPALRFVLTFDDGYRNIVQHAVPLLRRYGARGIVYVNPGWLDREHVPWWFQLAGTGPEAMRLRRDLASQGFGAYTSATEAETETWPQRLMDDLTARIPQEEFESWWHDMASPDGAPNDSDAEARLASWPELLAARDVLDIGSHTQTHCILGLCRDLEFARRQVTASKLAIESQMHQPCRHFAYPRGEVGDYNEQTHQLLASAGFATAVTSLTGVAKSGQNPLLIPRLYVSETSLPELGAELAGLAALWDRGVTRVRSQFGRL
jgi:peptidoglycan/xylan/chitin deacetylase (PgdA/CDA1 family)